MLAKKIGIDLGTSRVRIHVKGEGIVVDEPSIVAFDRGGTRLVAFGTQAAEMAARAPESVRIVRPLREGVMADLAATEGLLRYFIDKVQGRQRLFKPEIMISVASGVGSRERRDLTEAAIAAGARQAWLIDEPLAAALGAGLEIAQRRGSAICNVGGGMTEIAVIAESGTVVAHSIPVGGDRMDGAIAAHVRRMHNLLIGDHTAELVKISAGTAVPMNTPLVTVVDGLDTSSGEPRSANVSANDIADAIGECLRSIASAVRDVLAETPPRLADDIQRRGLILSGGGAQLRGLDRYLSTHSGIPVRIADQPQTSVVRGAGLALENFEVLKRNQSYVR